MNSANDVFYVWAPPGKGPSVRLSLDVVERLGVAATEGFTSLLSRGLETGGFLLGRTGRDEDGNFVQIENFEPLECEHMVGASYLLSSNDRKILEERIASHKSAGRGKIVGFYRTHTRKEFAITVEDIDLISAYFGKPSEVFLLIQSNSTGLARAGFFIWEGRKIRSNTPHLDFPFNRSALLSGGYEIQRLEPAFRRTRQPVSESLQRMARQIGGNAAMADPWFSRLGVRQAWKRIRPKRISTAVATLLRLGWRPLWAAAALAVLIIAVLASILNGNSNPGVPPGPLREVALRLDQTAGPAQTVNAAVDTAAATPGNVDVPRIATGVPADGRSDFLTGRPEEPSAGVAASAQEKKPGYRKWNAVTRPEAPPALRSIDAASLPVLTEPPALPVSAANPIPQSLYLQPALNGDSGEIPGARPSPIGNPYLSVVVEPVSDLGSKRLVEKIPLIGKRHKRADFVPPMPLRDAQPEIPASMRGRLKREVPIEVKVYVNPLGKVDYAELLSNGTGPNGDLAALAVFSSRRWEFTPARLGDERVPGEVILRFRFGPEAQ